jgi:hypothetical protein
VTDEPTPAPPSEDEPAPDRPSRMPAWEDELASHPRASVPPSAPTPPSEPAAASEPIPRFRLDELLADPPDLPTIGALTGYRDGARMRRRIIIVLLIGIVIAIAIGRWYVGWLEEQAARPPTPAYQLAEGTEGESRPDALVWTDGTARLGLSRQDPGVKAIVLPDRVITLAPGCDHAQIKVEVRDGKTIKLKVLVGEIQETSTQPDPQR